MEHGISSYRNFEKWGDTEGLNKAIECWRLVASVTSNPKARRVAALSNLGCAYGCRFERLGDVIDLKNAIECGKEAVSLTPHGHPDKPGYLDNLGVSYYTRFKQLRVVADLDMAVEYGTQAVALTPDGDAGRFGALNNLGLAYQARFEQFGEVTDVNKAIECGEQALSLTPDSHADNPSILNNLGVSYQTRFQRLGEVADLNKAIECGTRAVSLTLDVHAAKPRWLSNLGISYQIRFQRLGEAGDLSSAVKCGEQAVSLTPNNHAEKATYFNSLGNSYRTHFELHGDVKHIDKAIECGTWAVLHTPTGHASQPSRLNNLGSSYLTRFIRLGAVEDVNKAIEYGEQALSLGPDDHADKPNIFHNLGISYQTRFQRLGEVADLNQAIKYGLQSVTLTPGNHAVKPSRLSSLGNSYLARFGELGEVADVNKAIEWQKQAVSLTPDDHPDKPKYLNNLGNSYQRLGKVEDGNAAIECGTRAVSFTPDGHPDKPGYLNNLGLSYQTRFQQLGKVADVNEAIDRGIQADELTPDGHANKPMYLTNLGNSYRFKFEVSQPRRVSDLDSAIASYRRAAQSSGGSPSARLQACLSWAQLTSDHPTPSRYPAYLQAMDLLPQLVWIGNTLERRYKLIAKLGDFTTEAAAFAISADDLELALEWLEAGRSIVWGQTAQLRTPFELLAARDPALANRLKDIGVQLEHAGSLSSELMATDLNIVARGRMQLALKWDRLLEQARSIPGFENFLRPSKSDQLLSAAKSHPIVVVNVHETRCDALILKPASNISHVILDQFSAGTATAARKNLAPLVGYRRLVEDHELKFLGKPLKDLWTGVVKPVLECLGYMHKKPIDQLPRITWCTTGLLSFLPLHASGLYDSPHPNTFDLVISSYTPTLSALLKSQAKSTGAQCGILTVGQARSVRSMNPLPFVDDELTAIGNLAGTNAYLRLEDDEATVEQVLDAMNRFSWAHLACHGSQHIKNPTESAFHLHDGNLTLANITKQSFTNKGLAFLSACQTATGDESMPEEAVHLAAGMLMAGFPTVIGTMWSIKDKDGPVVAGKVYAELLKGGEMDHTQAAKALHKAIAHLREQADVGEEEVYRWAPFIHIGL